MARTLRDLDWSIRRGRTISLPNMLRLYRRRIGPAVGCVDRDAQAREMRHLSLLREQYPRGNRD